MKHILLSLLLFVSTAAFADNDVQDELKQHETDLNGVRQEQQAVYQNYQMVRDMRLMEVQEGIPPKPQYPYGTDLNTPPPNFDEVFRMQMEREQRIRHTPTTWRTCRSAIWSWSKSARRCSNRSGR